MIKYTLIFIIMLFVISLSFAGASYFYVYDNNGNRTSVAYVSSCRKKAPTETIETVFTSKVYPNPASNYVNLSFTEPLNKAVLRVYDVNGSIVIYETGLSAMHLIVDIADLSAGTYMVEIKQEENTLLIQKLVKQ